MNVPAKGTECFLAVFAILSPIQAQETIAASAMRAARKLDKNRFLHKTNCALFFLRNGHDFQVQAKGDVAIGAPAVVRRKDTLRKLASA